MKTLIDKNILVTGGAGFIGSNLCNSLALKNNVTSLDNYFTGRESNLDPGVFQVFGDVKDICTVFAGEEFDYVFHLGEYARVEQSFHEFEYVYINNVCSFHNVLSFAKEIQAKLIYSASSTVFAHGLGNEGISLSPYSLTKEINIKSLKSFASYYGLDYAIVYFYNAYGKNEVGIGKYATVVEKFISLVECGVRSLPVTSPGTQVRNFTDVRDICSALELIALRGSGDGYGIGSEEAFSIIELVELMGAVPKFSEDVAGNRLNADLRTQKTRELGWAPKHSLRSYIRDRLKISSASTEFEV